MDTSQLHDFFQTWITQQEKDLKHLQQTLHQDAKDDIKLRGVIEMFIEHLREYHEKRSFHAMNHAASFFSPTWSTSFENSFFWIGEYRPSLVIRLVYTLSGSEHDFQLGELMKTVKKNSLSEVGDEKLGLVRELQGRVVGEEEEISREMERFQEDIWGGPSVDGWTSELGRVDDCELDHVVDRAFKDQTLVLKGILDKADKLRLETVKELVMNILTPLQGVHLLVATIKLHISMRLWGRARDNIYEGVVPDSFSLKMHLTEMKFMNEGDMNNPNTKI